MLATCFTALSFTSLTGGIRYFCMAGKSTWRICQSCSRVVLLNKSSGDSAEPSSLSIAEASLEWVEFSGEGA